MSTATERPPDAQRAALDKLAIDTIRTLSIDAVERANSGHPGLPMGAAPMAYVLWSRYLRHNPANPAWFDRDRFVLSAGHGSMLLYSLLHLSGYDLSLDDLKQFRQWGSRTPGHPEHGHTPGVEATTGPLGQGLGMAVGMAMAERHLASIYNRPGHEIVSHHTYVLASDGDLMEGVASEAASLAGHLRLGRLIVLYDSNDVSLDGKTALAFSEDVPARFRAYGWHVQRVDDGNDLEAIARAIEAAQAETGRPSLIEVKTVLGYGAPNKAGTAAAHGAPLGAEEAQGAKAAYGWPAAEAFHVPEEVRAHFRAVAERGARLEQDWLGRVEAHEQAHAELARQFRRVMAGELPQGWAGEIPAFAPGSKLATRAASGQVLNAIARRLPELMGGSADLASSTQTTIKNEPTFSAENYGGRNIWFGVREFAMGAALNGMALHGGVRPYGGTFLVFSDYMRGAIRLAALMKLRVIYVFTHDSIAVGEDGPTHQPVEQVPSLRLIPGLTVLRPADATETAAAWRWAVERAEGPVALVLTRQGLPVLSPNSEGPARASPGTSGEGVWRGGYVVSEAQGGQPKALLLASGSEVSLAVAAQTLLAERGVPARVVSLPSFELFDAQPQAYRDSVLPPGVWARVSVEAAHPTGWERYVGERGRAVGIARFGASAPGERVMQELGFTPERVAGEVLAVLGGR